MFFSSLHSLGRVEFGSPLLDVTVLPVNILALQHQLGDALGLCQHISIACLDVGHEVGVHTRHRIFGHGVALFAVNIQQQLGLLHDCSLDTVGSLYTIHIGHQLGNNLSIFVFGF